MQFVACTFEAHAPAILAILNEAIENSTALYDYRPRPPESMIGWFKGKEAGRFPVIGATGDSGEHSVYVHRDHRGIGVGLALMKRLIATAREQQYHVLVGGIDVTNAGSIALHEKLGFVHAGTIAHAGFKFGRWQNLGFYQLVLDTPAHPVDG